MTKPQNHRESYCRTVLLDPSPSLLISFLGPGCPLPLQLAAQIMLQHVFQLLRRSRELSLIGGLNSNPRSGQSFVVSWVPRSVTPLDFTHNPMARRSGKTRRWRRHCGAPRFTLSYHGPSRFSGANLHTSM